MVTSILWIFLCGDNDFFDLPFSNEGQSLGVAMVPAEPHCSQDLGDGQLSNKVGTTAIRLLSS